MHVSSYVFHCCPVPCSALPCPTLPSCDQERDKEAQQKRLTKTKDPTVFTFHTHAGTDAGQGSGGSAAGGSSSGSRSSGSGIDNGSRGSSGNSLFGKVKGDNSKSISSKTSNGGKQSEESSLVKYVNGVSTSSSDNTSSSSSSGGNSSSAYIGKKRDRENIISSSSRSSVDNAENASDSHTKYIVCATSSDAAAHVPAATTATIAANGSGDGDTWICARCTTINNMFLPYCEACEQQREEAMNASPGRQGGYKHDNCWNEREEAEGGKKRREEEEEEKEEEDQEVLILTDTGARRSSSLAFRKKRKIICI
jgi:hypothetical protein